MALDRLGDFEEHVDFADFSFARTQAFHHTPHPARAFTAGRALTAAFMFVEIRQERNGANNISGLVNDNDGCSTEPRTEFTQDIEINGGFHYLRSWNQRKHRHTGNETEPTSPPPTNANT